MGYVYALSNKHRGVIYIGVTAHLAQRLFQHKSKMIDGFASKYNLTNLVWYEAYPTICEAIAAEKRYKNWRRAWKINLIEKMNPEWNDLAIN